MEISGGRCSRLREQPVQRLRGGIMPGDPWSQAASMAGGASKGVCGGGAEVREVVGIQTSDLSRSASHPTCIFPGSLCPLCVEQYMGRRYQESS